MALLVLTVLTVALPRATHGADANRLTASSSSPSRLAGSRGNTFSASSGDFTTPGQDDPVAWGVAFLDYHFGVDVLYKDDTRPVRAVRNAP